MYCLVDECNPFRIHAEYVEKRCRARDHSIHEFFWVCDKSRRSLSIAFQDMVAYNAKRQEEKWLCSAVYKSIQSAVQKLVESGEKCLPKYLVGHLLSKRKGKKTVPNNIDATWKLLQGNICEEETKNLLSKAVRIFHDQFDKIKAGNIDLIPPMVHGRNCSWNTDFRGMYCAILSINQIICYMCWHYPYIWR